MEPLTIDILYQFQKEKTIHVEGTLDGFDYDEMLCPLIPNLANFQGASILRIGNVTMQKGEQKCEQGTDHGICFSFK